MCVRLTWTDCDEAGDYVMLNVLSPRVLVSRSDHKDETVLHTFNLCLASLAGLNDSCSKNPEFGVSRDMP